MKSEALIKNKFTHRISKGSRFNQIYIPKEFNSSFEVGDLVEIKLLEKKTSLYYSKNLEILSNFKEKLVKDIFFILSEFEGIKQIFVVGSFLTNKIDYNDIDVLIISDKNLENKIYNELTENFNLKFHIILIPVKRLDYLERSCPLTRSMLYYFVSNKDFNLPLDIEIDKKHIQFLLMMPEDLLKLNMGSNSRVFYDNLRRLISIEKFLEKKDIDPIKLDKEVSDLIGSDIFILIKNNEKLDEKILLKLKHVISLKLNIIRRLLKHQEL